MSRRGTLSTLSMSPITRWFCGGIRSTQTITSRRLTGSTRTTRERERVTEHAAIHRRKTRKTVDRCVSVDRVDWQKNNARLVDRAGHGGTVSVYLAGSLRARNTIAYVIKCDRCFTEPRREAVSPSLFCQQDGDRSGDVVGCVQGAVVPALGPATVASEAAHLGGARAPT